MNRFAHLKTPAVEPPEAPAATEQVIDAGKIAEVTPEPARTPARSVRTPEPVRAEPTPEAANLPGATLTPGTTELEEVVDLVERRIGIVGKIPASLKDNYDEMVLRSRKYIGRPNADLAVQAWVELTLEDENIRRLWLKRIQDLKK